MLCIFLTGVPLNERVSFHRLASVYFSLGKYEMAENYYLKSLSLCPTALEHAIEVRYYVKVYCRLADMTLYRLKVRLSLCLTFYRYIHPRLNIFNVSVHAENHALTCIHMYFCLKTFYESDSHHL